MNIKKAILFSLLVVAGTTAFAQSGNLRKAKAGLQKFQELQNNNLPPEQLAQLGKKDLDGAKEAIDAAITHDKTKDNPETWTIYALVNANLATLEKSAEAVQAAEEGIQKATELDSDEKNKENIAVAKQLLGQFNFGQGADAFNSQDYKTAYTAFDQALLYLPGDTTLIYYSGLSAIQNQDYPNAIKRYTELIPQKEFSQHKAVMVDLPKLYLSAKDTTNALEYAAKAAAEYPDDNDASVQNIELNLLTGNEDKIISEIENQIAKDADNKALYYYLGIAYSASDNNDKAIEAYKKAVEIDPNYVEANKNASATIINSVRDQLNTLNDDKTLSNTDYSTKVEQLKEQIKEALPYLEKVVELDPKDIDALRSLKGYYDFQQDEAKSAETQAKIEALQE
ncbi:tetratricopeptide repeat protein [Sphingobacterium phlebotomi]|uniref:Tetratricopeptide repeat protein n=1 Tax=Sphingobacterium phlebotomi TaxID=2605433 RepID=A0A5D4GXJ1_9SPHI|nr:tetratricopeptide repeat protein [Sphingobacterium phlebotomi]TYR32579.1 tetratricopeptide repeat protein [Sphingobacterium phlebotomi]